MANKYVNRKHQSISNQHMVEYEFDALEKLHIKFVLCIWKLSFHSFVYTLRKMDVLSISSYTKIRVVYVFISERTVLCTPPEILKDFITEQIKRKLD